MCPKLVVETARHSRERWRRDPTAGSLYLFDRSRCRYFRKDGHNWRKKKDGKTVRETHEKLKVRTQIPPPTPRDSTEILIAPCTCVLRGRG